MFWWWPRLFQARETLGLGAPGLDPSPGLDVLAGTHIKGVGGAWIGDAADQVGVGTVGVDIAPYISSWKSRSADVASSLVGCQPSQ